jgi:hypothetical protein
MTPIQIASLVGVAALAAYFYLPRIQIPKPSSMSQIESVLAIRDNTNNPEVRAACSALLQALLK